MTTENTEKLYDLDNQYLSIKKVEKIADVDPTLTQIIKVNDCVNINIDFLVAHVNSLLEHIRYNHIH